jgi:hypothetical protein
VATPVAIRTGSGSNTMDDVRSIHTQADFQVRASDNTAVVHNSKVKITGKVNRAGPSCGFYADTIEIAE